MGDAATEKSDFEGRNVAAVADSETAGKEGTVDIGEDDLNVI